MAKEDDKKALEADLAEPADAKALGPETASEVEVVGVVESLGADKYVFAAFFGAAIGVAFLVGKILAALWNSLSNWPAAVRQLPWLLRFGEEERSTYTTTAGALIGIIAMVACLRNEGLRRWADDVALELSKVTWPKKETVTNGTIVVIAAGLFATIYIGLLDRLWGFVTMLVYGA